MRPDATELVGRLFTRAEMLDSRDAWRAAGFEVVDREGSREIMVASHPLATGVMFKRFTNKVDARDQLENYRLRADGAAALRRLIVEYRLQRVTVPEKQIVPLSWGRSAHVLVVERLPVLSRRQTREAYPKIDDQTLRDLCVVVHQFRGLDSGARNMLITTDGRVAFVDTERWKDRKDRSESSYFGHVRKY
jgi:hypothetical protein